MAQDTPSDLAALTERAGLKTPVSSWCRAEFRAGHAGAFAVAIVSGERGGRYVALDSDGSVRELATFKRSPDLSCYSRAEAEKLDATLKETDTVHGRVTPRWTTTVVCGFIDDTAAVCWQYSPADRAFVQVGRWVT